MPRSPAPTSTAGNGSEPVRGRFRVVVGDPTATLGVAGVAPGAVGSPAAATVVDELGAPAAGSVVDDVGWTVDVVRGAVVDVLVEVGVDVVVVVAGTHQAGMVVVVLGGALVVDSGVVLATVVLDGTVVVDVVQGVVVEVVGAAVVVVRGVVVDVVGATVVLLLLVGGTVVDVVGTVVEVVATTEYEYDTQTVADADDSNQ